MQRVRILFQQLRNYVAENRQVLHNASALAIIQAATYFLPLITLPYVVRTVGMDKYGILAFANAFTAYFVILTDYGFRISAPRAIALHRADTRRMSSIVTSILLIKLCLLVGSIPLLGLGLLLSVQLRAQWRIQLYTHGLVIARIISLTWFFQGVERMKYITILSLLAKVLYVILLFTIVRAEADFYLIPILGSLTEILAGVAGIVIVARTFGICFTHWTLGDLLTQLKEGWYTFLSTVSINAYTATPVFAVGVFAGTRVAGDYSVAQRIATAFQTFPLGSVLSAIYPRLSSIYPDNPRASYKLMTVCQKVTTGVYMAALPVVYLLVPFGVQLVTGARHPEIIWALRLLALAVVCINANAFRLQFLLVSGLYEIYSRIHVYAGIIGSASVFLGAFLLANMGPPIALALTALLVLVWTRKELKRHLAAQIWEQNGCDECPVARS